MRYTDRMSMIEDHTPVGPVNAASFNDDLELAGYVRELFIRARAARRPLVAQWKKNYRTLHNKQWAPRAESWMPSPEVAQVFPIISVTAGSQPFSDYYDFYATLARDMNAILDANFVANSLDLEIAKNLWDVYTYGVGYFKTVWEPWLADGIGDTAFRRVDPFTIYPDPWARSMSDLTYIVEAKLMTISDVDRAWPGAAGKLRAFTEDIDEAPHKLDDTTSNTMPRVRLGNLQQLAYNANGTVKDKSFATTPGVTRYSIGADNRDRGLRDEQVVSVLECWIRDHNVTATDDEGVMRVRDVWRCIVVCGNQILMNEEAGDINAYGTHPYSRNVLTDMGEWYGPSLVELLASPQESIGRMLTAIEQNIALMGNPVLLESPRSPSRSKRISNRPGQRIEAQPDQVQWMNPPQIHPDMSMQLIAFYKGEMESISGLSAMVRGFSPGGRNSQGVLDQVQDAAFVRVRASLRQLEAALRDVCSKMCANIAEFYTEPRLLAQVGPDGSQTHLALRARHFYTRDADNPDERIPLRFSLLADAGSQMPTSKQARAAEAERMYALGAIDVYELLKAKDWPNWRIVAQRVMSQQAQQGILGQGPTKRQATRA